MLESVLLILLGWLLGILGGPIAKAIDRRGRQKELLEAIHQELSDSRQLMASVAFRIRAFLGTIDREFLQWMLEVWTPDATPDPEMVVTRGRLETMAALDAEELAQLADVLRPQRASLNVKVYALPLVDASVPELALLSPDDRREILAIRQGLDVMNQDVPTIKAMHEKTFDGSLNVGSRAIVEGNLTRSYEVMADRAVDLANRIGRFQRAQKLTLTNPERRHNKGLNLTG